MNGLLLPAPWNALSLLDLFPSSHWLFPFFGAGRGDVIVDQWAINDDVIASQ